MLIHTVTKLYEPPMHVKVELLHIEIPECALTLTAGKEIVARRPYPNKRYLVACRNQGLKAMHGILIETDVHLDTYTVITSWLVNDQLIRHQVKHQVLDRQFDAVSDDMTLWYNYTNTNKDWQSRWPEQYTEVPIERQPRMDVIANETVRPKDVVDKVEGVIIVERQETFKLHTIERDRIFGKIGIYHDRMPTIEDAFQARAMV